MKLPAFISILVALLAQTSDAKNLSGDRYFQSYREIIGKPPATGHELELLIASSPLKDSTAVASVYHALLDSLVDHPTGFEKYHTSPSSTLIKLKKSHPALFYRHQILEAYNLGIGGDWPDAIQRIDEVISFSEQSDKELYFDAIATKSQFLARVGLLRASLNELAVVLDALPSLSQKRFFGDGAIENAELFIGLTKSYLEEYDQALVLCARAETFFSGRPASAPFRYYQMSLDCQRRSYEGLARYTEAEDILESYIRFAEQIEDWDSFVYGLVLKLNIYFQTNSSESAPQLIESTKRFVASLPGSYDKTSYEIARFEALLMQDKLFEANALSADIEQMLAKTSDNSLLQAEFRSAQAELFEKTGNLQPALNALKDSKHYYQDLYYQTDGRNEFFSDYYESELAQRKLQLLSKEHELTQLNLSKTSRFNALLLMGAAVLTIAVVFIGYLLSVQRKLKAEQEELATTDSLTGIRNRRSALQAIDIEIDKAKRHQQPLSLAIIDLDHFKSINDRFGHDAGDALLKAFSHFISRSIRKSDIFARYGGEEFVLCLPMTSVEKAETMLNNILSMYNAEMFCGGNIRNQTFSAGVKEYEAGDTTMSLITHCDEALYKAKNAGRGQVSRADR